MRKEYELKTTLQNYLISYPESPVKRIVRDLRWDFPNLSKRDINPILYREKQIFWSEMFFIGFRMTDDGVKAAATNSMSVLTQVEGVYDSYLNKYQPPKPYSTWKEVVDDGMNQGVLRLWDERKIWQSTESSP